MPIAAGSLRPTNVKLVPVLLQLAFFFLLYPLVVLPALLPLGVELALDGLGWVQGVPIYLLVSLPTFALVVWIYRLVLTWQGKLLLARELQILQVVAVRAE
jgi:hypothetical protein